MEFEDVNDISLGLSVCCGINGIVDRWK
uniref:Uncharacterized protein n=1 Tax=Rhizophora mucronata TaxID=61149 RepID=A0A2P2QEB1_RHIMU